MWHQTVSESFVAPLRQTVKAPGSGPISDALGSVAVMETTGAFVVMGVFWAMPLWARAIKTNNDRHSFQTNLFIFSLFSGAQQTFHKELHSRLWIIKAVSQ